MKMKSRAPSASIAKALLKKREQKKGLKASAEALEKEHRKKGGFGVKVVSVWAKVKGGIEKSPAYRKVVTRCQVDAKGKPPSPEDRDGAFVKGGHPLKSYPPNVIVDGMRASWLPDDWAQVIKNTGPGGTYLGWMGPKGGFFYHRSGYPGAIEETLGRKLKSFDGLNGMIRAATKIIRPGQDEECLKNCLTAAERKHLLPASKFHFAVVSAYRADIDSGIHDIAVVEGLFRQAGVTPTWYVDKDSLAKYKKLGLNAKVGGKLTPSRNMALNDAKKLGKVCVQVSDDISRWSYYDCEKQDYRGEKDFKKANAAIRGARKHVISPLAAAQLILAKMRADPEKPQLGGVFPTANAAMTLGLNEIGKQHFILGDFFVAEAASPCRFDTTITLKEDYDYTCTHIKKHGSVLRLNRMFLAVKHSSNAGGAVAARDAKGVKEKKNIAILQRKWPGVFALNKNRKDADTEVKMNWNGYNKVAPATGGKTKVVVAKGKKSFLSKVKNSKLKAKKAKLTNFPGTAVLKYTGKEATADYITRRCKRCHMKKVEACLGMKFTDANGTQKTYNAQDLKYDVNGAMLSVKN